MINELTTNVVIKVLVSDRPYPLRVAKTGKLAFSVASRKPYVKPGSNVNQAVDRTSRYREAALCSSSGMTEDGFSFGIRDNKIKTMTVNVPVNTNGSQLMISTRGAARGPRAKPRPNAIPYSDIVRPNRSFGVMDVTQTCDP